MTVEQWWQDLRHAVRGLRRAPGFTATAVLTLAVGIAGTTVMFALVQGVLLRPLPVHDQEGLVVAWKELRSVGFPHFPFSAAELDVLEEESRLLERASGVAYWGTSQWTSREDGEASYVSGTPVTGDLFGVLGVEPALGRALEPGDDVAGAENVLVIGYGLWQRRFGGAAEVIGRRLEVQEQPFTIVGVMPPGFEYPRGVEAWMTGAAYMTTITDPRYGPFYDLVARLRPEATLEQAAAELGTLIEGLEAESPAGAPAGATPVVHAFADAVVGEVRSAMLLLFGSVGLVLLIASANVANLLLMRGEARRPELAVRAALGAGRRRLVRQLVAESVVLAIAAGVLGLAITWWSLQTLVALVPDGLPRIDSVRIDLGVVLFTVLVACLTAALAGVAPALSSARIDLASQLRSGGRGVRGSGARHGRRALVVAQVALAVAVVAAAGLLTRSLYQLQTLETGMASDRLVFVELALPQAKYGDPDPHLNFLEEMMAELEALPGIAAATPVNSPPFSGSGGWDMPLFTAEGQSTEEARTNPSLNLESIHPGYFDAFEIPIVRGRGFMESDREGMPEVAVVSQDVAEHLWSGEDPVGKRLKGGAPDADQPWRTVVGVAGPTRYRELAEARATLYLPVRQFDSTSRMIVLRTDAPLAGVAALAREAVRAVDADVDVMRVAPFSEFLAEPLARPRFNAFLLGVFGVAALLLAAVGLYAVMGAFVRQREAELGIRMALGATAGDVRRLVLVEGLKLAGAGAAVGLAGAFAFTRLLRGLLVDVHPLDSASMIAAALLLVGVSAVASYLPARHATRVDPIGTLRAR